MKHQLIIFFNEDYSKNIPILERLYRDRFSHICYVVPDHYTKLDKWYRYPGKSFRLANNADIAVSVLRHLLRRKNQHTLLDRSAVSDIYRVIGFKYYFQDFFWQTQRRLLQSEADWFWFVSDDVLLNPAINEHNIVDFFSLSEHSRSLICTPYYRSDEWVDWFQGSSEQTIERLRTMNAYPQDYRQQEFPNDPHLHGPNQRKVLGGCADFFACHRELLPAFLKACHTLALQKVFVEIAIPNVLLSLDSAITLLNDFHWEFDIERGSDERIRGFVDQPGAKAFYHPVKLALLGSDLIEQVCAARASL